MKLYIFLCTVLTFTVLITKTVFSHDLPLNNGTIEEYSEAASLSGDTREIQRLTKRLWPRATAGQNYSSGDHELAISENDRFVIIESNNIPDHNLSTTNPNCAVVQNFKFLIPKTPKILNSPQKITSSIQEIGVALNGVVIAGPYDSENKIAPYNRVVDLCSSHADPRGLYHYHFAPLCMKDINGKILTLDVQQQIGWSFDGYQIKGLADRESHLPTMDTCNGHKHGEEYHYHVTRDFPFFMGCYKATPQPSNFRLKRQNAKSNFSACVVSGRNLGNIHNKDRTRNSTIGEPRPNFTNAVSVLNISEKEIKAALGPPPGNFAKAARKLKISEQKLRKALLLE